MTTAYERPFHPIDLENSELRKFALRAMVAQLETEESLHESGRASLTLVHGPGLTVVLTAARTRTTFEEHQAAGPTLFIVLTGSLAVMPAGQPALALTEGDAFALGPDVRHTLEARSNCAFLTIIGEQSSSDVTG
jgi:quercetin dioxygenase-like cupin family protein